MSLYPRRNERGLQTVRAKSKTTNNNDGSSGISGNNFKSSTKGGAETAIAPPAAVVGSSCLLGVVAIGATAVKQALAGTT